MVTTTAGEQSRPLSKIEISLDWLSTLLFVPYALRYWSTPFTRVVQNILKYVLVVPPKLLLDVFSYSFRRNNSFIQNVAANFQFLI